MIAAKSIAEFSEQPTLPVVGRLLAEQTREMLASADGFRRWTREHLMLREPTAEELKQHEQVCKVLIRLLGFVQLALTDPDFPQKSLATEVAFNIRRLNEDWEMLHNAMAEADAKHMIPELFAA